MRKIIVGFLFNTFWTTNIVAQFGRDGTQVEYFGDVT